MAVADITMQCDEGHNRVYFRNGGGQSQLAEVGDFHAPDGNKSLSGCWLYEFQALGEQIRDAVVERMRSATTL